MQLADADVERGLRQVVVEVEEHVNEQGWDQPGRLFALAPTVELASEQPELAAELGITMAGTDGSIPLFTAIEQELDLGEESLEAMLTRIEWPVSVHGTVAVLHRLVLPPEAEDEVPDDPMDAGAFALAHPQRREVRMGVGVARSGATHCVIRVRPDEGNDEAVLQGRDLVPGLVSALRATLDLTEGDGEPPTARHDAATHDTAKPEMAEPETAKHETGPGDRQTDPAPDDDTEEGQA